jgi:hypothetical protein
MGLLDSLMMTKPINDFLELLNRVQDWEPMEKGSQTLSRAENK